MVLGLSPSHPPTPRSIVSAVLQGILVSRPVAALTLIKYLMVIIVESKNRSSQEEYFMSR